MNINSSDIASIRNFIKINQLTWEAEPSVVCVYSPLMGTDFVAPLIEFLRELKLSVVYDDFKGADFIILIGTNSTNLALSLSIQFQNTKPVLSLSVKRKGFISNIPFESYREVIPRILRGDCWVLPRSRLCVRYCGLNETRTYCVLNEMAVNRNPISNSLLINCSSGDFGFSQIRGDGVIISTSTGSTAYNTAAGGPLIHPLLPAFLLTPLCALSLSARPILFPSSAKLTISLEPEESEPMACITIDGNIHIPFTVGETVEISLSPYFYNSIILDESFKEWHLCLEHLMGWNQRKHQKPLSGK